MENIQLKACGVSWSACTMAIAEAETKEMMPICAQSMVTSAPSSCLALAR